MSGIALLILAAGESKRMGTPKQLLPWHDTHLLGNVIAKGMASDVDEVIVVLGAFGDRIETRIKHSKIHVVHNPSWSLGMGTSISFGINYIEAHFPETEAVLITLTDLPLIDTDHYQQIISQSKVTEKGIIGTQYDQIIGVPALFKRNYFTELAQLNGAVGAKSVLRKFQTDLESIISEHPFTDIDTPEAYEALVRTNSQGS